jgi:hypothetical protein
MQTERLINRVWRSFSHRKLALLILILIIATQIIAFALPQVPVPPSESAVFNRWLAEFRTVLGTRTKAMASLGLLTIRSSYFLRLTLGLLALAVVAHIDRLRVAASSSEAEMQEPSESLDDRREAEIPRGIMLARGLLALGGLLIIVGWAGQMLWGWREPRVTAWPGASIQLPDRGLTLPQPSGFIGVWQGRYGLYTLARGQQSGLEVQAFDEDGDRLVLLPSVEKEPRDVLQIALARHEPEAFFAVPDAELIFRLNQLEDRIEAQAFRSASGELLAEIQILDGSPQAALQINDVEIEFTTVLLPRYEVIYNPTAIVEALGLLLFAGGTIALLIHPPTEIDEQPSPSDDGEEA